MIPILYDYGETQFASNGLCRLRDCISCVVTEERNGVYELDFEYPVDGANFEQIQCGRAVACTHEDSNDIQPFDIISHSKPINGIVTFHGVHISYRLNGKVRTGKNINSLAAAFERMAAAAGPFSFSADFSGTAYVAAFDGVPKTLREYLGGVEGSILDTFGGEYEFDKFNVILHRNRGTRKDFAIRYGVNLLDYNNDTDYSDTFNAAVPYWIGQNKKGEETIVVGSAISSGEQTYLKQNITFPLDLSEKFEEKPTKAELEAEAASWLSANKPYNPEQTITVDFVQLQEDFGQYANLLSCKLCDSIRVIFPLYGENNYYKIVKTTYNVLLDRYEEMELGSLSTSLSDLIANGSGSFVEGNVLGGLFQITTMAVSVSALSAHANLARSDYTVPEASRVEDYNLAGIVGVETGNYRVNSQTHFVKDNQTISAAFANVTASSASATTVKFYLLWLKGTQI